VKITVRKNHDNTFIISSENIRHYASKIRSSTVVLSYFRSLFTFSARGK